MVEAKDLYAGACAACHGVNGDGAGPAATQLGAPYPRDFTMGVYKFTSTPTGSAPTTEDLARTIAGGVPGTWMPAWADLLDQDEIWALAQYLKGFSKGWAWDAGKPLSIPDPPSLGPEDVREGRMLYAVLACDRCHGLEGRGDGPSSESLKDDWGRPIKAYDFTRGQYRSGSSSRSLYRTLITGVGGTPMPALGEEALLFPSDLEPPAPVERKGLPSEVQAQLENYLRTQPTRARLANMEAQDRASLAERRLWALVAYIRSLERQGGFLQWLLRDNPDLDRKKGGMTP